MIAHQAEAIVLRTWPVHEADQIVSLLTRDLGRIKGVAKSAARSRRRFGGALEPMTHVRANYVVRPRQELVRLDSFEILRSPLSEPIDYARVAALSFYAEVLDEMLPEHDPSDAVFRLLVSVLAETQISRTWMPVTYFALWMTRLMGLLPSLRQCAVCRHSLLERSLLDLGGQSIWWSRHADGLFCAEHRTLGSEALSWSSLQVAHSMLRAPMDAFAIEPWPRQRARDLFRFVCSALERHLEHRLATAAVLLKLSS